MYELHLRVARRVSPAICYKEGHWILKIQTHCPSPHNWNLTHSPWDDRQHSLRTGARVWDPERLKLEPQLSCLLAI